MATTRHVEMSVDSQGKEREVEVFVFQNPRKRKEERQNEKSKMKQPQGLKGQAKQFTASSLQKITGEVQTVQFMDLETARKEVRNFGIQAMVGRSKIEARLSQLKSLGAEIPKNWERKIEKRRLREEFQRRTQDMKAGIKTKKPTDPTKNSQRMQAEKERKKKEKGDVFFDSKVGTYKNGVQFISAADIKRISGKSAASKPTPPPPSASAAAASSKSKFKSKGKRKL